MEPVAGVKEKMAKQPESVIKDGVIKHLKAECPGAVVWKLSDRYTRGIPDVLFLGANKEGNLVVMLLEIKTPSGKASALQESVIERINSIEATQGIIFAGIVRSVQEARLLTAWMGL